MNKNDPRQLGYRARDELYKQPKPAGFWRTIYIMMKTKRLLKWCELMQKEERYEEAEPALAEVKRLLDELETPAPVRR